MLTHTQLDQYHTVTSILDQRQLQVFTRHVVELSLAMYVSMYNVNTHVFMSHMDIRIYGCTYTHIHMRICILHAYAYVQNAVTSEQSGGPH